MSTLLAATRAPVTCYSVAVTVRHAVLPIGAVVVLGLGVYLFVEVRAQPVPPTQIERAPRPAPVVPHGAPAAAAETAAPTRPASTGKIVLPHPASGSSTQLTAPAITAADAGAPPAAEPPLTDPKVDALMAEANKAYDRGDYDEAKQLAVRLLAQVPTSVRMMRIMVSASCIDGDSAVALTDYPKLPPVDQEQMKVRCARYGIVFPDTP